MRKRVKGFLTILQNYRAFKSKTYKALKTLFDFVKVCLNLFDFVVLMQQCKNVVLVLTIF